MNIFRAALSPVKSQAEPVSPSDPSSPSRSPSPSPAPMAPRKPMPYDTPDPSGRNWLLEMPEEVLQEIFLNMGLHDLTVCFRLCKDLNSFLTESAAINLRHTLMAHSLRLNPHATIANPKVPRQMPLTSAKMLAHLRETLTRFRNLTPQGTSKVVFREPSGSLYEYLEGVLLRTSRPTYRDRGEKSNTLHVYDLRRVDEWEDTEDNLDSDAEVFETASDSPMENDYKTDHKFDFKIQEVAIDPTQDLLLVVSLSPVSEPGQSRGTQYIMEFHLFSLSTFEPHPKAEQHIIEFPVRLNVPKIQLDFQICDDGLYVLNKSMGTTDITDPRPQLSDMLFGWQWTTGRLHCKLEAPDNVAFESFVLLTPSSFCIPSTINRPEHIRENFWSSHLYLYAFPPLSDVPPVGRQEQWTAQHVWTLDMPPFKNDILRGVPPQRMSIRTDPPPRHYNSPYPLHAPPPFLPDPESGVAIINFGIHHNFLPMMNQNLDWASYFTLIVQKKTLIKLLPEPTSPLLKHTFSRPVPVLPWRKLAPNARFLGPDRLETAWVCFVYQNRYVAPHARVIGHLERDDPMDDDSEEEEDPEIIELKLQVYDFDPRRARKEKLDRARRLPPSVEEVDDKALEGDVDGIQLVLSETKVGPVPCLLEEEVVTGRNMPYIMVQKATESMNPLIDGQRILQLMPKTVRRDESGQAILPDSDDDSDSDSDDEGMISIMEF